MIERFHADPRVQATELLLQERVPRQQPITEPRPLDEMIGDRADRSACRCGATGRSHTVFPHTQFLSNGKLRHGRHQRRRRRQLLRRLAVTRWRQRRDHATPAATYIYLRDIRSGAVWSPTYHPTQQEPTSYLATFQPDKATFDRRRRRDRARGSKSRWLAEARRRGATRCSS